ncbi:YHYH protein [uncultured Roseobacter sp.]|uniref:YHYH protein n=1 Tax=uncultured Roseobacter sp. TaxID=114847 RepID=UPI002623BFF9|nr:YHYH protein [uncultured Roseobacter sp.]
MMIFEVFPRFGTQNLAKYGLFLALVCLSSTAIPEDSDARLEKIAQVFADATIVSGPTRVECTLSGGTETTCFSITVSDDPKTYTPGPWCPRSIEDAADAGGIWLHDGKVHDVDGSFIEGLAEFYGDTKWQLFDPETGAVRFTGTLAACEAAARPDVDPDYQNHCVECLPEYVPDEATTTYVIPLEPGAPEGAFPTRMSGSGVAYNGVRLDGPAPLDAILSAYTLAPFDDCGGHVNLHVGYHYHAVTDCLNDGPEASLPAHGAQVGIAMDGHPILMHLMADGSEPADLDRCNGHVGEDGTYHYHAGAAGSNAILGCLRSEAGCTLNDPDAICDATARRPRP